MAAYMNQSLSHHPQEFYTDDPKTFEDYGRIVNQRHFKRVMALMEGNTIAIGGENDETECYIGIWVSCF